MVINLCLPQFRPRIHCNKISADGYEVENLISEDLTKRNRGFRTEYFIKPPVHITISFPFGVEVCRVNVDLAAGGLHAATGLDVYTSTSSSRSSWGRVESQPLGGPEKEGFTLVGKALLKSQSRVTFSHRGFKARPPFQLPEAEPSYPGAVSQELWNRGPSSLHQVTHVKLCITHVVGGGCPCIKRVEVWGQPARSCPHEVLASILPVASQSPPRGPAPMESDCGPPSGSEEDRSPGLRELADGVPDVPEEFLDPITLEIMPFPMLLPSGKVIDRSTLEKCNRSEATWGRVPSDPFTGVAFGHQSQPLPHPALKARIDHFLLQHRVPGCHLLGRGQAAGLVAPSSSIALPSLKRKLGCLEASPLGDPPAIPSSSVPPARAKKLKTDSEPSLTHMDCSTGPVSHEQRLSESLDTALMSALSSMPSFTTRLAKGLPPCSSEGSSSSWGANPAPELTQSSAGHGCAACGRTFSPYFKTEPVYQLPCGHLVCRPCLAVQQGSQSVLCASCKRSVASQDVLRVHF
ncbi:RING finger protein 37 [Ornithorhynchus anatinus]|uniref:RING finger protein 37 n=1 Tax=Ornithorhynchus anatinus TaxID=9258 RepID=UPI00028F28A5|nr:RING finger protein 37 [Ornithorhynchus anatinus]